MRDRVKDFVYCNNFMYNIDISQVLMQDCSDILKDCMDEEQLDSYKDEQYKNALGNIQANIESWDSDKCPAVK